MLFNCAISGAVKIGKNTKFGYVGIAVIGHNCKIGTSVTIGFTSKKYEVPIIGDNVRISTGAKILGPIKVGNNIIIYKYSEKRYYIF